ncbi:MAG TPA: amidase [Thermodesulfobacteriota bacterium]
MFRHARRLAPFTASVAAFREGRDTPRAFLERCIETIETREGELKAFVVLDLDGARAAADASTKRYRDGRPLSPIDGCPVGVKDIIETADMPTQMNSPVYAGWRPGRDAACVRALRLGGAVVLGKTVTTEFAIGRSGPTLNPLDPSRTPGGSSSGSAAAVGAGMASVALGSQTNGSTIRPASYCGIHGFKPTLGALPTGGMHPLSTTLDHLGVLGASLADVWAVARQMADVGGTPGSPGLPGRGHELPAAVPPKRLVRLYTKGWQEAELDDATRAAFEEVAGRLRAAGVEIVDRSTDRELADLEALLDEHVDTSADILAYEMRWPYAEYVERHGEALGPRIRGLVARAAEITQDDYRRLLDVRRRVQAKVMELADRADGFVTLAASGPAPRGLDFTGSRTFLIYWSWLGFPCFSLPLMQVEGLPVGLQLMGYAHADDALAARAVWIENAAIAPPAAS